MKIVDREHASQVFEAYISHYDQTDPKIKLKIDHTYRVNSLSERIAKELKLTEEEIDLAWLIGLLHDIGRFEQIKDYGTFYDRESVDHAQYGVKLLFEKGKIRDFVETDEYDEIIREAISNHNVLRLPKGLSEKTLLFCKIIRDADKIDIFKVNVDIPFEEIYSSLEESLQNSMVSEVVEQEFYKKTCINHALKTTAMDFYISHASLVFELEFPISYRLTREQGYLDQIMSFRNDNQACNQKLDAMQRFLNGFLQEQIAK